MVLKLGDARDLKWVDGEGEGSKTFSLCSIFLLSRFSCALMRRDERGSCCGWGLNVFGVIAMFVPERATEVNSGSSGRSLC